MPDSTASSTETPIESPAADASASRRAAAFGAFEASAFNVPLSLGAVTLIFSRIGPEALAAAMVATLLSLACIQVATLPSRRPILYSARFFEAAALGAMLDQFSDRLAGWSLPDTPGVRIAFLCAVMAAAGLVVGVLYLARADRFSRFIPAPVFAGFSTSIAVILLITQSRSLATMLSAGPALPIAVVMTGSLLAAFILRARAPRWPAAVIALAAGLVLGIASTAIGKPVPMLGDSSFGMTLPILLADFGAFLAPGVNLGVIASSVAVNAAILGSMMFVNSTLTSQVLTHADGREPDRRPMLTWHAVCLALAGAVGSAPLSGGYQASLAATRKASIGPTMMLATAAFLALVCLSGVLAWTPLAAVVGVLLCEAWYMVDRTSLRHLVLWLRRQPLSANQREDLALVSAVTATAVVINMIAAVFVGWLLGLLLFAARSARRPVRHVWTGAHMSSNCARPRRDVEALEQHGGKLRVVEFDRDLFFGSVDSLERALRAELDEAECIVLDWSLVRHVDSSAAQALGKFEREATVQGVSVIHVEGAGRDHVREALNPFIPARRVVQDLDRALEFAENTVLARRDLSHADDETLTHFDNASLLLGLSTASRLALDRAMLQRTVPRGGSLVTAGQPAAELLLVLRGSASVILPQQDGSDLRIAGVRHGATIGEMGFLDGSIRSASVVADEDTVVAVLTRTAFDDIERNDPQLARQLVTNIALDVATRLRHSNRLALSRHGSRQAA